MNQIQSSPAQDEHKHDEHEHAESIGVLELIIRLIVVILPFAGLVTAMVMLWGWRFNWVQLGLLVGAYCVTGLGITIGYHRLFTHRAFETHRLIKIILAISGSMATEGPLLKWVAQHRRHHQHSDCEEDPHSPHQHGGGGVWGTIAGLWHAHIGWAFKPDIQGLEKYVTDLKNDPWLTKISELFPLWAILGLIIPAVLGGLLTMTWMGVLEGFLWGGLARVFLVHHVTWSINSICHVWGTRPFKSDDESRNNFIFGVLGFGEGWHNNHHAFPTSARHGLYWWQIDMSYWIIYAMSLVGLAWKVKVPVAAHLDIKRR